MDVTALWDFEDPAGSEARLLAAAAEATDPTEARLLTTQVARALGLQERYDEAHELLDTVLSHDPAGAGELDVRVLLERGRLRRSAGDPSAARPLLEAAAGLARSIGGLEGLEVDALHMVALVAPPDEQVALTRAALDRALASDDPAARAWAPSLLHNLGMAHADAGAWDPALDAFEQALAAREDGDDDSRTRVARWMVAWALRHLGRTDEALTAQRALRADLDAAGESDPYVDEEITLLTSGD